MAAPPRRPASLSVVIVNWESFPELTGCVASLARHRPEPRLLGVELCVVDNGSRHLDEDALRRCWPDLLLIRNQENRGFGPAANQGVARTGGEVVLFLNPDTRATAGALVELAHGFASGPDVVGVAPRLVDAATPGIEPQERFHLRRLPTLGQVLRELLLLDKLFPASAAIRRERYLDADRSRPFAVEQPAAAALAVRREVFLAAGGFDERFVPAWFEDVDLCRRLTEFGTLLYWPAATFEHVGGVSAVRLGYHRFLPTYYRNACRYVRKYGGLCGELGFRALLAVGMALRLAVLPFRRSVPRARREAALAYARTALVALGLPPPPVS